MGFFSIAIGLGALGALQAVGRDDRPPVGTAVANAMTLLAIMAVGVAHLGPLQIWGGLTGIAMFAPSIFDWTVVRGNDDPEAELRASPPAVASEDL